MRYRSRPHSARADENTNFDADRHPGRIHDLTVFDREPTWQPLGILDAKGEMIERYAGMEPVGFLWNILGRDD